MNIALSPPTEYLPVSPQRLGRLTVRQYHRMIETGILTEDDPIELLEGLLVVKMPRDPAHDGTISLVAREFFRRAGEDWPVRVQCAVTTGDSEPEPDLAIVRGPLERYLDHHPGRAEIALVVEVANTSLADDRHVKGRVYARARFAVYWIINLNDRWIEVYTQPRSGRYPTYRDRKDYGENQAIPFVLPGRPVGEIAVKKLLPPRPNDDLPR
jgi:Uma2 family endonuclease